MPSECLHELMRVLSASAAVCLVGPGDMDVRDQSASICWCEACGVVLVETATHTRRKRKTWLLPRSLQRAGAVRRA